MSEPENSFWILQNHKNSPLGPQKIKKTTPKLSENQKSELKENKSCSTIWLEPEIVFGPYPNPKNTPLGHEKVKNYPKTKSKK